MLSWQTAAVSVYLQGGASEQYQLMDIDGRIRARGYLQGGRGFFQNLRPGVYVIRVMTGARDMMTEKIVVI